MLKALTYVQGESVTTHAYSYTHERAWGYPMEKYPSSVGCGVDDLPNVRGWGRGGSTWQPLQLQPAAHRRPSQAWSLLGTLGHFYTDPSSPSFSWCLPLPPPLGSCTVHRREGGVWIDKQEDGMNYTGLVTAG